MKNLEKDSTYWNLVQAIRDRQVVLFVGAGMSTALRGTKLWSDCLTSITKEAESVADLKVPRSRAYFKALRTIANDEPLFSDDSEEHGMSKLFRHWLAGQLVCAREMTYFLAPYINSYKRFQAGSFAPTSASWSFDNRTAGFRVLGRGAGLRVECRVPGADVNPYLAYAATVAAGLHGIENELELEPALEGNLYENRDAREVPKTLREALALLEESEILKTAFGEEVVEHYLHTGRWEQGEYDRRVTDWERRRNFERA